MKQDPPTRSFAIVLRQNLPNINKPNEKLLYWKAFIEILLYAGLMENIFNDIFNVQNFTIIYILYIWILIKWSSIEDIRSLLTNWLLASFSRPQNRGQNKTQAITETQVQCDSSVNC